MNEDEKNIQRIKNFLTLGIFTEDPDVENMSVSDIIIGIGIAIVFVTLFVVFAL